MWGCVQHSKEVFKPARIPPCELHCTMKRRKCFPYVSMITCFRFLLSRRVRDGGSTISEGASTSWRLWGGLNVIHSDAVIDVINQFSMSVVLQILQLKRSTAAGCCRRLNSFSARNGGNLQNVCPACDTSSLKKRHLLGWPEKFTQITADDLWLPAYHLNLDIDPEPYLWRLSICNLYNNYTLLLMIM